MRQVYLDDDANNVVVGFSLYSPSEGYVAFGKWIGYTTDSCRTFTKKYITNFNVNFNGYGASLTLGFEILGVKAFNYNTLIVYGSYGYVPSILYSTDGGNSFTLIYWSQYNPGILRGGITDMIFPENNTVGYAVDADRILKTSNQGLTWTVISIYEAAYFTNLGAVDNNKLTVYVKRGKQFIKTSDGGLNWSDITLPQINGGKIACAYFRTAEEGWLNMTDGNNNGYTYVTKNGGNTWQQQNNPDVNDYYFDELKFFSSTTGYGIAGFNVYKTINSGATWEPLPRDNNFTYLVNGPNTLFFQGENRFWAGTAHGHIELTTNGGGSPKPRAFFSVDTVGTDEAGKVRLINYSNPGYQIKWFVNNVLISTDYNLIYKRNTTVPHDTIMLVVTTGTLSDTAIKYRDFVVHELPVITSFNPITGSNGTFITIKGLFFTKATVVKFGDVPPTSFTIFSDSIITATIGNGASGQIIVENRYGPSTPSSQQFTYFPESADPTPVITSVFPPQGNIGTEIIISGSGFAENMQNNLLLFGGTKASIISATANKIICKVPPGATFNPISILNKSNNLSAESPKSFNVTFSDKSQNFTPNSFSGAAYFFDDNYHYPKDATAKDIDGDGKLDIVACFFGGYQYDSVGVFRNTSTKTKFSFDGVANIGFLSSSYYGKININDIDGDGKPEIAVATNGPEILIFRNKSVPGSILFDDQLSLATLDGTQDVSISDMDDDGKNDLLIPSYNYRAVSIIRNTSYPGFLSFGETQDFECGGSPTDIAVGDLDGDGKKDFVACYGISPNNTQTGFSCFRNTSVKRSISFAPKTDLTAPGYMLNGRYISMVDYDADGKLDVVILNDAGYSVFRNLSVKGNIIFDIPISYSWRYSGGAGIVANFNGDGKPDILAAAGMYSRLLLLKNTSGQGAISADLGVELQAQFYGLASADLNLDGKEDIIGTTDKQIYVYQNKVDVPVLQNICIADNINSVIKTDVQGLTYKWQQNINGQYADVTNSEYISGSTEMLLNFNNIPSSWDGNVYRCIVDNSIYSSDFKITIFNRWTGYFDSSWENPENWSCYKVPDANTNVFIDPVDWGGYLLPANVLIESDVSCKSITVAPGSTVTIAAGKKLIITH